jgi:hypothetical protein
VVKGYILHIKAVGCDIKFIFQITIPEERGLLDTGTVLTFFNDDVVDQIYAAIPGAKYSDEDGGWIYPTHATLPVIQVDIGGHLWDFHPRSLAYNHLNNGWIYGGVRDIQLNNKGKFAYYCADSKNR